MVGAGVGLGLALALALALESAAGTDADVDGLVFLRTVDSAGCELRAAQSWRGARGLWLR